jgi:hypothetical protein
MAQASEWGQKWAQIVNQAATDAAFKKRLISDPKAVLKEKGLEVPQGVTVKIVENTDQLLHLTLPPPASSQELSEADIAAIAGGMAAGKYTAGDKIGRK